MNIFSNEKNQQLARDFEEVAQDEERNAEIAEWDQFIGDGLDETNEYHAGDKK